MHVWRCFEKISRKTVKMIEYSESIPRFILMKSTKSSFSLVRTWNMDLIHAKMVPMNHWHWKEHKTYAWYVFKIHRSAAKVQKRHLVDVKKILLFRSCHSVGLIYSFQKRIFSISTIWMFWTLATDLCILKTYDANILCFLQCQKSIRIILAYTTPIFEVLT